MWYTQVLFLSVCLVWIRLWPWCTSYSLLPSFFIATLYNGCCDLLCLLVLSNSCHLTLGVELTSDLCKAINFDIIYTFMFVQYLRPLLRGCAHNCWFRSINHVFQSPIFRLLKVTVNVIEVTLGRLRARSLTVGRMPLIIILYEFSFLRTLGMFCPFLARFARLFKSVSLCWFLLRNYLVRCLDFGISYWLMHSVVD